MKKFITERPERWGINGRCADWAGYWDYAPEVRPASKTVHSILRVDGQYWVVETNIDAPDDIPVSGPFDTEDAAWAVLRMVEST